MTRFLIILLIIVSGCTMSRKVNKAETLTSEKGSLVNDTKTSIMDKGLTITTRDLDSCVNTPAESVNGASVGRSVRIVVNGDTLTATYDPNKNTTSASYTAKSHKIPVHVHEVIQKQNYVVQVVDKKLDSTYNNSKRETSKVVDSHTSFVLFCIIAFVVIIALVFLALKYFHIL